MVNVTLVSNLGIHIIQCSPTIPKTKFTGILIVVKRNLVLETMVLFAKIGDVKNKQSSNCKSINTKNTIENKAKFLST